MHRRACCRPRRSCCTRQHAEHRSFAISLASGSVPLVPSSVAGSPDDIGLLGFGSSALITPPLVLNASNAASGFALALTGPFSRVRASFIYMLTLSQTLSDPVHLHLRLYRAALSNLSMILLLSLDVTIPAGRVSRGDIFSASTNDYVPLANGGVPSSGGPFFLLATVEIDSVTVGEVQLPGLMSGSADLWAEAPRTVCRCTGLLWDDA